MVIRKLFTILKLITQFEAFRCVEHKTVFETVCFAEGHIKVAVFLFKWVGNSSPCEGDCTAHGLSWKMSLKAL